MSTDFSRRQLLGGGAVWLGSGMLLGCGGGSEDSASSEVKASVAALAQPRAVRYWNQVALQAIRDTKPGPPIVARALAILFTAMYDAWAAYDSVAVSTRTRSALRRPAEERTAANKNKAMHIAAYLACVDQFPGTTQKLKFDAALVAAGCQISEVASADPRSPQGVGAMAAKEVIAYRHSDGANQLGTLSATGKPFSDYTGYAPKNPALMVAETTPLSLIPQPAHWQPLSYRDASGVLVTPAFIAPHWQSVLPFALTSGSQFRPPPPAVFGTAAFVEQAQHVVDLQLALTEEQKIIAEHWADGPSSELPPGHWSLIAQYVSERDQFTDDQDARLFFALSNAMMDAGIAAWDAKRHYDYVRPISAIRHLFSGRTVTGIGLAGPAGAMTQIAAESWRPYQLDSFPTPPFAEYVSGHSTYSSSAAEVLKLFTGSDRYGGSRTQSARSMRIDEKLPSAAMTMSWATFTQAAEQAGMSRLYGGIHFSDGNTAGLALGRKVGVSAFAKAQSYWNGTAV
jgi:hypothetical protein